MLAYKVNELLLSSGIVFLILAIPVKAQRAEAIRGEQATERKFECPKKITSHPCGATLNHLTVSKPEPEYPDEAKAAGATGGVSVCVQVDEDGSVYSAVSCKGHSLLRQAATDAAYRARLRRVYVAGKPIKYTGMLMYNFATQPDKRYPKLPQKISLFPTAVKPRVETRPPHTRRAS
jgi:hypothetical protein